MNRILLTVVLLTFSVIVDAQIRKLSTRENFGAGSFEAGLAASIGLNTIQKDLPGNNYIYGNYNDDRKVYLGLSTSLGYYILDGLSVEPKLGINLTFDESTVIITGNIRYTFNDKSRATYPYLVIGYGVTDVKGNTGDQAGLFESLNYKVITGGAGLKFMQSSNRAFVLELNYGYIYGTDGVQYYSYMDNTFSSQPVKTSMSLLTFSFGYFFEF